MDISPTPEVRAACRIVLGGDDPATVIGALQAEDLGPWQRVSAVHDAIIGLKALAHPTIDAMDAVFDRCCPWSDFETRRAIAKATAEIDSVKANALRAEAAALRALARSKRAPANDA